MPQIMVVNRMAAVNCTADMKLAVLDVAKTTTAATEHERTRPMRPRPPSLFRCELITFRRARNMLLARWFRW